ncbi:spermatogenic leucine zipper protein 1 [Meriones unguiculatus]|uniref:spermatogenic leucine zipper protein 1 n=1 Tax=Meriones unguiculatus TaxID=10047 RepID=UPI000B4F72BA|nr:spermatogenic leucine zipper protein 1 [Meriones unguiculatus]
MANFDSPHEKLAPPQIRIPNQGSSPNPGITISFLEIGSLPHLCWDYIPPPKNSISPVGRTGTVQKFSNLLKDIKDVLKSIAGIEDKPTAVRESFDDASTSEDVSKLKIRAVDRRNKMQLKDMVFHFDPEREQYTNKAEMFLKNQSAKNMVQAFTWDVCDSEKRRSFDNLKLSAERGRCGSFIIREGYRKLRSNMEQLLQEADHWSRQHSELRELIRLYQECQKEGSCRIYSQTQPSNGQSAKRELEVQVKNLNRDAHSLHLIASMLQDECQVLKQRVDILNSFPLHEAGPLYERPVQMCGEQDRKSSRSAEAYRMEASKHTMKTMEGISSRKDKIFRTSDASLTKKARNNRSSTRVAKKSLAGKRRSFH